MVDDDPNDRLLFASALEDSGVAADLWEADSGFAAMNYLLGHPDYADREKFPIPDVVFLDVKMQGMDGFAVLREIRRRPAIKNLPVIVFSNSTILADSKTAYALAANAFYEKPASFRKLVNLLRAVLTPWEKLEPTASARKFGRR